ncbi:Protein of unknown function DUF1616 [Methanococcus aeolicus Nankai-3]|uniref:DUF1616 domain-containing protein n=1 Tax=Methanococcus aeolicus (strain ATCC BAA-1280 / DSM 17508 / OCM 812 / Nankai-3) TaxID=419665 RepID=A6UU27_META3|nr:DUF1616 domain-containing protein [Methanococcus aeolicus]ABR55999.1 Protein of unknown function DUF1616 [Methanococcus aeolicus Nankai-3]
MNLKRYLANLKEGLDWNNRSKLNKFLTIFFLILLVSSLIATIYIIENPKQTEYFTEFYILGQTGKAYDYPTNLFAGQNGTVIIGVVNREGKEMNYTVEIYLVNATYNDINITENITNDTYGTNSIIINNITRLDKFDNILLYPKPIVVEGNWSSQWETPYMININKSGNYQLWFLLFENETYKNDSETQKIYHGINNDILSLKLNIEVKKSYMWG